MTQLEIYKQMRRITHKEMNKEKNNSTMKETFRNRLTQKVIQNNINEVAELCHRLAVDAGWHDTPREVGTMLALIHSEISEAMEGFRKDLNDDHLPHRKMAEVELADAVIRIFDLAGREGFNIGAAIAEKLAYNATREDHKPENRAKKGGKKF